MSPELRIHSPFNAPERFTPPVAGNHAKRKKETTRMSRFVNPWPLNRKLRRHQRNDQLDDRLRADMGLPGEQLRHAEPFLLGSLIVR